MKITFVLLSFLSTLVLFGQNKELTITYVGNMGVLISGSKHSLLIDGLHDEYKPAYQFPSPKLVEKMTQNTHIKPPISLVLNTHFHPDHYDNQLVINFLKKNKKAHFIGTEQSVSDLKKIKDLSSQMTGIPTNEHGRQKANNPYLNISAFFLNHVNPRMHSETKNIGFLIEIDGKKIVHFGDAFWIPEVMEKLALHKENIDIAILPAWMIASAENRKLIHQFIQPKKVIATHISPTYPQTLENLREFFPEAVSFTEVLQEVKYFPE